MAHIGMKCEEVNHERQKGRSLVAAFSSRRDPGNLNIWALTVSLDAIRKVISSYRMCSTSATRVSDKDGPRGVKRVLHTVSPIREVI